MRRKGTAISFAFCASVAVACNDAPKPAEIERLRAEAKAENERQKLVHRDAGAVENWSVEVRGEVPGQARVLSLERLWAMATDVVTTLAPTTGVPYKDQHTFRGVLLARALEGIVPKGSSEGEITVVGSDGYFSVFSLDDIRHTPILLALERDGEPVPRVRGGPVLLVLPITDFPGLTTKYGEGGWVFYVSGVIAGSPKPRLGVNGTIWDPARVASLPRQHRRQSVRFRHGWGNGDHDIAGPRLRDFFIAPPTAPTRGDAGAADAGTASLPSKVVLWSFARERGVDATVVTREDIERCDPILVTGDTPDVRPFPASRGGPTLLAPLPSCTAPWAADPWPTFILGFEGVP